MIGISRWIWWLGLLLALTGGVFLLDPRSRDLLLQSLCVALGVAAISVPLGTAIALLIFRTDMPGRRLALAIVVVLLFFPLYLQAAGWDAGFGQLGWHSFLTGQLGETPLLAGVRAAVFIHAVAALPWVVLIVGVGLATVKPEYEEQAALDGGPLRVLTRVTLPRATAFAGAAALWVAVTTAGEITVTDLYRVRTFAEQVYLGYAIDSTTTPLPATARAATVGLTLLSLAALAAMAGLAPRDDTVTQRPRYQFPLARWRSLAALIVFATLLAAVAVPVVNLCVQGGAIVDETPRGLRRSWSVAQLAGQIVASPWRFGKEFGWTAAIAASAATLAVALALPIAHWAARGRWRSALAIVPAAFCLALPGPTIGLSIIALLNRRQFTPLVMLYDQSILAPVLAVAVRAFPIVVLILWYSFSTLARDTSEAAASEGAAWWTTLLRVVVPQRLGAIVCAWLIAATIGVGELSATILVLPPGVTTLSNRTFTLLHYGVTDQLAGLCLAQLLLVAVMALLVLRIGVRQRETLW